MSRLAANDEAAFAQLYNLLSGQVFALSLRLLRSREEAEEVLQDTFFTLYREAKSYEPTRGSVRAFVYTLARNQALSRLRARQSRPHKAEDRDPHDSAQNFSAEADNVEDRMLIRELLKQLSQEDQHLIRASFFEGYSHGQLAEQLGLPLGTIKSRLRRALLELRKHVEAS